MSLQYCRGGVVAGDDDYFGLEFDQARQGCIDLFYNADLPHEVTVFTGAVGLFDVKKNKVVLGIVTGEGNELVFYGMATIYYLHPNQLSQPSIHWISGNS